MRKSVIIGLILVIAAIIVVWYFMGSSETTGTKILVPVKNGQFVINVTTTGELEAKNSEKIFGPSGLRSVRIWNVKIEDIIPDGTVVDSGEYVATLDRTEISNRLKDLESEVEKLESQHIRTRLDTSMDLRNARNELINMKYSLEEKKIKLEQSKFEPPATIRQYQIDLEKADRDYSEAQRNYKLKLEKAEATMKEITVSLNQEKRNLDQIIEVVDQFIVRAPKAGMVIYRRNWDGSKMGVGATVSAWDNVVAELPDLAKMMSKTYINEIDISKVKTTQDVEIGVDAFPEMAFTGKVVEVANIGEQMKNSNAKVFEVKIEVKEFDSILRPAMTTKNTIITAIIDSVDFIPIECLHSNDSLSFVYTTRKTKQQVIPGRSNENEIIIKAGLAEGEMIHLIPPENKDSYKLIQLDTTIINKFKRGKSLKKSSSGTQDSASLKNMTPEQVKKIMESGGGRRRTGKRSQ